MFNHIRKVGSITKRHAHDDYGIDNLPFYVLKMKRAGIAIKAERKVHPVTLTAYTEYRLA